MDTLGGKNKKKKQKNKCKSVLRGPQSVPMVVAGEEGGCLREKLKELGSLPRSSDCQVEQAPEEERSKNTLKKDLVFGVNEIMRCLRRSDCIILGLVVTNPLSTHLQLTLHEVCLQRKVPCLFLDNLHDLSHSLHLSSLTALAFKNSCQVPGSICHSVYSQFMKIYEEKTGNQVHESQPVTQGKGEEKDPEKKTPSKTVIHPTTDQLYVSKSSRKFFPESVLEPSLVEEPEDCITITQTGIYFPNRLSDRIIAVTEIISKECDRSLSRVDPSFVKNLIDTPESDRSEKGGLDKREKYMTTEVIQLQTERKGNKRKKKHQKQAAGKSVTKK